MSRFTLLKDFRPKGHAVYIDETTDKLLLVDNSGQGPDDCEDGPLFIKKNPELVTHQMSDDYGLAVPVHKGSDATSSYRVYVNPSVAGFLLERLLKREEYVTII